MEPEDTRGARAERGTGARLRRIPAHPADGLPGHRSMERLQMIYGSLEVARDIVGRASLIYPRVSGAPDRCVLESVRSAADSLAQALEILEGHIERVNSTA